MSHHPDLGPPVPVLEAAPAGFAILDGDRRYLYANPAACDTFGSPREKLLGQDVLTNFPADVHDTIQGHLSSALVGNTARGTTVILRSDGEEREVEYSVTPMVVDGQTLVGLAFRDMSDVRRLERRAAALTKIASSVAFGESLEATLDSLARSVVRATGTVGCGVLLVDASTHRIRVHGTYGIPEDQTAGFKACLRDSLPRPVLKAIESRQAVVVRDARSLLLADPCFAPVHDLLREALWDAIVAVPLIYRGRVVGTLTVFYPKDRDPGEAEIGFLSTIADQAAVAAENARLFIEARDKAALEERQRLARELHDSVSQALYGIALGARSARTMLDRDPRQAVEPLDYVLSLAEAGLAEMRALIFELRPESLETEGLIAALEKRLAAVRARHGFVVHATLPEEPDVPLEMKQAVYRIAQEALHNTAKHARAKRVNLRLHWDTEEILLAIADDGRGFNADGSFPGHLGLRSMRERAESLGGTLEVESTPGQGTRVQARIPRTGLG